MSFLKFLFYVVAAYLVIRFLNRLLSPKPSRPESTGGHRSQNQPGNPDRPKFNIEADTVEYEIIEEEKEKDEK